MMRLIAGSQWTAIAVVVLVVGLTSYFVIQYIQEVEEDKIILDIQEETNDRRKVIRDAIKETPRPKSRAPSTSSPPSGTESSGMQYFRERQGR